MRPHGLCLSNLGKLMVVFSLATILHLKRPLPKNLPGARPINTIAIQPQEITHGFQVGGLILRQSS